MVLPTSPPASMSVSQILAEFGITAGTTKRISNDLFPLVGGTAGSTCLLGASFSGKSATKVGYSTIGGTGVDVGYGITVDSAGNIYVTGQYNSSTTVPINTFGTAPTASPYSLPATTGTDAFVIKWSGSTGAVLAWTNLKGSGTEIGYGIAVDSAGNIYVTGQYNSTSVLPILTFSTAPAASGFNLPLTGTITARVFVIKWSGSTGAVLAWSYITGNPSGISQGIAVDSSQNVYITGQYNSSILGAIQTFGTAPTASGVSLPTSAGTDVFVIKWNGSNGTVAGYSTIRGNNNDTGYSIAVDSSQNIYITGDYISSTTVPINTFGTAPTASGVSMPISTGTDAFVIKWNGSNGTLAGYTNIKSTGTDTVRSIAVDSSQNIYVTGQYTSSTTVPINTFGTAPTASGFSMPISVSVDAFVIKWNGAGGTVAGYTNIQSNSGDIGYGIAVDSSQNIYITGNYNSTTTVPIRTFGTAPTASGVSLPITMGTTSDAFVIKWNVNGTLAGYSTINGTVTDIGNGIAVDSSQNIYITGQYISTGTVPINTFGTAPSASGVSLPITAGTAADAFVIKWNA